jgi:hypothetical protein
MPSPQIHLFATRQDLEPGIRSIESELPLKYALCETFESSDTPVWRSLLDLENLGKAPKGNQVLCERYLVLPARAELHVETFTQYNREIRYTVDQLHNWRSIVFQPGGVFGEGYLICGHIGTASSHPESLSLLGDFTRAVTRGFQKYRLYLVGPEASKLHEKGCRLITMHVDEAREYDLDTLQDKR